MKKKQNTAALVNRTELRVRFCEVDSMNIVWHGEYVRYFEDGREAFGRQYEGLGYMDIYNSGYLAPMVDIHMEYKRAMRLNDEAIVETRYIDNDAAKICFEYTITRKSDGEVMATGSSTQVFLNPKEELELTSPKFFIDWKRKWNIG